MPGGGCLAGTENAATSDFGALLLPAAASSALDLKGLGAPAEACVDFDAYVNGQWKAATPIPPDRARIGSFETLRDESREIVEKALAEAALVMTALVALEQKPLSTVMPVSKNATLAPPCKIYAHADERWPLDNLLYCILLNSANDASVVIAEGTAGSVEKFADLMNRRAAEIGALHTNFVNPHG